MYEGYKRFFDIVFSLIAIFCVSWLLLLLYVLVALVSKSNPVFTQERVGKEEDLFTIFKFKTIVNNKSNFFFRFLRRSSLDELPQFFNVLKGDMSIVGPRPLLEEYVLLYSREQKRRHEVLPGITGLTQVSGANELGWERRLALDVEYVKRRSLSFDFSILIRTIFLLKFLKKTSMSSSQKFTGK